MRSLSSWFKLGAAAATLAAPTAAQAHQLQSYRFHYDHVLGTSLDLTAVASDEASALMAATAARREIVRLDAILSGWRGDAELARLNADGAVQASPELREVLARCEAWRAETGGAFDCRMGAPLALWRTDLAAGTREAALAGAMQAARSELEIDGARVRRPAGVQLAVDGMAKGYVIDAAMAAARRASPGLKGLMVDIGGDLRCWGRAVQPQGWRVGLAGRDLADNAPAEAVLNLGDRAVAFSGRGARDLKVEGCALSHTLSPATGRPVEDVSSAVVLADNAADADALATAFMVMAPEQAVALANRLQGVDALVTTREGARYASDGWADHLEAGGRPQRVNASFATVTASAAAAAPAARGAGLELSYEVPRIEADPYHAPYVAAWITDETHRLVKTLLLLGQKPRWVTENYVWWRRYGRNEPAVLDTVAKPTRPPGRYTARWDGRDEAGQPVAPGRYILHIEAAREKGGHTYETAEFDLGGQLAKALPAKDELGAVELRYGPPR